MELTEQSILATMAAVTGRLALAPTKMLVSTYGAAVLRLVDTAEREQWNWRRIKRELRRADTSRYHRQH